ncbi:MAG: FAD-dependent oxidoreductase, partial [Ornithinimicrobium sp.]
MSTPAIESSRAYDFVVVGGGIVGLATAYTLLQRRPGASLVLLEKEDRLGAHQSGHNSGVIHAGVYYKPGSLKARLCAAGALRTREFCDTHGIAYRDTGKLIVATSETEVGRMDALAQRASANGLSLERLDAAELRRREPNVTGVAALFSPTSGIVDYKQVCRVLAHLIQTAGAVVATGAAVVDITESLSEVRLDLEVTDGSGDPEPQSQRVYGKQVVVCGGIQADRLATMAGLDIDFQMVPFRGEYYRLA